MNHTAGTLPFTFARVVTMTIHFAIIAYMAIGWTATTRIALFVYAVLVPLIVLQWLFNRGASFVSNLESLATTGRWRNPDNEYEGRLFQALLRKVGLNFTQAQICTLLVITMMMFWMVAMFRMVIVD
jgi:hypothetical protein